MKVPRRSPAHRPPARDRVRPTAARGATRPARRAPRGRVSASVLSEAQPPAVLAVHRSPFTRRAVVFASVLLLIATSVAYPAQRYVAQHRHIEQLRAQVAADAAAVATLERQTALRTQAFYVQREARQRLHYVLPGEAALRVVDAPAAPGTTWAMGEGPVAGGLVPGGMVGGQPTGAWWNRLLNSVTVAATPVERLPAGRRPDPGSPVAR